MKTIPDSRLAAARQVYAGLIRVYPRSFREAYGPLLLQLFCDQYRAAREQIDEFRRITTNGASLGSMALGAWLFVLLGAAIVAISLPAPQAGSPYADGVKFVFVFGGYFVVLRLLLKGWLALGLSLLWDSVLYQATTQASAVTRRLLIPLPLALARWVYRFCGVNTSRF